MNISLGIVGMPNVGKSTLFNALTNNAIPAENYPFCTIDPNVGVVPVIDPRLDQLADLEQPDKITPAVIEFWDIAGLVKGAAQGQGLGNQFLANIRNVSAIVHVVRAFHNDNITHVENSVDPLRDLELINAELILKDIETLQKKIISFGAQVRGNAKLKPIMDMYENLMEHLSAEKSAHAFAINPAEQDLVTAFHELFLLSAKPVLYVVNSTDQRMQADIDAIQAAVGPKAKVIGMDIKLEAEISQLPLAEQAEYLEGLGMQEPALARLTREAYALLGLISFFTSGKQEVRAWTINQGALAPEAAGTIHTDFEKKFITAEIVPHAEFIAAKGWTVAKQSGKVKLAGRDYQMQDGDVVLFRHG